MRTVPRRQDVRRSSIRRMEGIKRVGHDPDADPNTRGDPIRSSRTHRRSALRCDRADDHAGYEARPRSLAQSRRSLSEVDRSSPTTHCSDRRTSSSLFDSVRFGTRWRQLLLHDSVQGAWNSGPNTRTATRVTAPASRGGYFPVPPVDAYQDSASAMCLACEELRDEGGSAPTTKSPPPGSRRSASARAPWYRRPTRCSC